MSIPRIMQSKIRIPRLRGYLGLYSSATGEAPQKPVWRRSYVWLLILLLACVALFYSVNATAQTDIPQAALRHMLARLDPAIVLRPALATGNGHQSI